MDLLADGGMGRLVYTSRYGPIALPVMYKIDGGSIVLSTWDPVLFDEDLRTGESDHFLGQPGPPGMMSWHVTGCPQVPRR
jgi:hypothetical protein